jgi:transposase
MVEGTKGSHHKEGSTKMAKTSIVCAGIDTGKSKLDVAIDNSTETVQVENGPGGFEALGRWLRQRKVRRVGIEASGGYEQEVVAFLRSRGLVVIVLQPLQVRAYARFKLQLAKNDKIDAVLIAECTAQTELRDPPDPRLIPMAQHLTLIEQLTEDVAQNKTRREACRDEHGRAFWTDEIRRLNRLIAAQLERLVAAIRQHRDLSDRLDLINSVAGVGLRTAAVVLVRMPEIGKVTREQAAALIGLAPYDDDSAKRHGERHIQGGRQRLRKALYAAALPAAFFWNPQLKAFYKRLRAAGKSHKGALVACARKLLIFINTVVQRGKPWTPAEHFEQTKTVPLFDPAAVPSSRPAIATTSRTAAVKAGRRCRPAPISFAIKAAP